VQEFNGAGDADPNRAGDDGGGRHGCSPRCCDCWCDRSSKLARTPTP